MFSGGFVWAPNRDVVLPKADLARLVASAAVFFRFDPSWLKRSAALLAALPTFCVRLFAALPNVCVGDLGGGVAAPPIPNDERGEPLSSCAIRIGGGDFGSVLTVAELPNDEGRAGGGVEVLKVVPPNVLPVCFGTTTGGVTGLSVLAIVPVPTFDTDGFVSATLVEKVDFDAVIGGLIFRHFSATKPSRTLHSFRPSKSNDVKNVCI